MVRIVFSAMAACTLLLFSGALTPVRANEDFTAPYEKSSGTSLPSFDKKADCSTFSDCHKDDKVKNEAMAPAPHQLENSFDDNRAHTKSLSGIVADQLKPSNGR